METRSRLIHKLVVKRSVYGSSNHSVLRLEQWLNMKPPVKSMKNEFIYTYDLSWHDLEREIKWAMDSDEWIVVFE